MGGLTAAIDLASRGHDVTVVERATGPGGKLFPACVDGQPIDSGPTVLTMRWVFDSLFDDVGECLDEHLVLKPAVILARHAWSDNESLDLFADPNRSAEAIGDFAGGAEARGFRAFSERARLIYETLKGPFISAPRPTPFSLAREAGFVGLSNLLRPSPFNTLWRAVGTYFKDERLRQLFGRYATYCGSSPFNATAILMLVAHVEQSGVWLVAGGMHRLADALSACAKRQGAAFRYECQAERIEVDHGRAIGVSLASGERIAADMVLVNADVAAVATGRFGHQVTSAVAAPAPAMRSLSAVTFVLHANTSGFPLIRHNVFFSSNYRREFDEIFCHRQIPEQPTVYVCAQDRPAEDNAALENEERLLVLVNAPPVGDQRSFSAEEIEQCRLRTFDMLHRCGLEIQARPQAMITATPSDFERLYPATGGALYGAASHGWTASFSRPVARSRIPGLYFAGGSTHPGPGVPMAALSGRLAAATMLQDLASTRTSRRVAISGGMSMG